MANLSKITLENLPEWKVIEVYANDLVRDYMDEIIACAERGETAQMCEKAGRIAGIKMLMAYPETFAGGEHAQKPNRETD